MLERSGTEYELIVVDDGTGAALKKELIEYFHARPNATLLLSDVNEGRGAAITRGISASTKEYVGFIDTDLEISETYLLKLYEVIVKENKDAVIGRRVYKFNRNINNWIRNIASRIYFFIANIVLNMHFLDTETGIKIFRRSAVLHALGNVRDKRWFWDTELMAESLKNHLKVAQVPVRVDRKDKKSSVSVIKDSLEYIKGLYRYRNRGST
jgi:dolichyl-phosphate beta-glucosyltransferase